MTKREGGEIAEIKLRCREVLRVQLETEALANNRSVDEEINKRLEASLEAHIRTDILTSRLFAMVLDFLAQQKGKEVNFEMVGDLVDEWTRTESLARGINTHREWLVLMNRLHFADQQHPVWGSAVQGYFGNKSISAEQTVEDGKPATPVASPTEQAAWAPVMAQEPHPDEKANDRRTAKGKKRKTRAK
jgi:hypothetical protein